MSNISNNSVSSQGSKSLSVVSQRILAPPSSSVNRNQLQEIRQSVLNQMSKNKSYSPEFRQEVKNLSIRLATQEVQKIQNAQHSALRKMVTNARKSAQKAIPRTAKIVSTTISWTLKPVRMVDNLVSPLPLVGPLYKIGKFLFVLQFACNIVYRLNNGVLIFAYNSVKGIPYTPPEYTPLIPGWAKSAYSISWKVVSYLYGKIYRGDTPNLTANVKQFAKNAFAKGVNTVVNITHNKLQSTKENFGQMIANSGNELSEMISQSINNFKSKGWAQSVLAAGMEKATTYFIDRSGAVLALPNASPKTRNINVLSLPAGAVENWNNGMVLN